MCVHNCSEAVHFLLVRCCGEVPVVGIGCEVSLLIGTQPVDGRYEEPGGRIRFQRSGGEEIGIGRTVLAGGPYVYVFPGLVHIHGVGNRM